MHRSREVCRIGSCDVRLNEFSDCDELNSIDPAKSLDLLSGLSLRKQVRPGLRERQVSAGRMQHDPAVRDCGGNRSTVLIGVAACISKLRVDGCDRQPTGVIGFYRVGDL
jgi:hypothetical protein